MPPPNPSSTTTSTACLHISLLSSEKATSTPWHAATLREAESIFIASQGTRTRSPSWICRSTMFLELWHILDCDSSQRRSTS
jgi:hypothetical protein